MNQQSKTVCLYIAVHLRRHEIHGRNIWHMRTARLWVGTANLHNLFLLCSSALLLNSCQNRTCIDSSVNYNQTQFCTVYNTSTCVRAVRSHTHLSTYLLQTLLVDSTSNKLVY